MACQDGPRIPIRRLSIWDRALANNLNGLIGVDALHLAIKATLVSPLARDAASHFHDIAQGEGLNARRFDILAALFALDRLWQLLAALHSTMKEFDDLAHAQNPTKKPPASFPEATQIILCRLVP